MLVKGATDDNVAQVLHQPASLDKMPMLSNGGVEQHLASNRTDFKDIQNTAN